MFKGIITIVVLVCLSFYAMCIAAAREDRRNGWK